MKKLLALIFAVVLAFTFTLVACENNTDTEDTDNKNTSANDTSSSDTSSDDTESNGEDTSDENTTDDTVMTYAEYIAADVDTEVVIETYVQAKQSWWTDSDGVSKSTFYTQDEDGAYFIYNMSCSEDEYNSLTVGTKIKVTGYKSEWSGEVEIIDATFEILDGSYIAEAFDATELLGTDELIDHQNEFVTFKGMTVEDYGDGTAFAYKNETEGNDIYFKVSYNGETYDFVVESDLCDSTTDVYSAVTSLSIGDTIDLEGFLYWYEGANPHITSVTAAE